jgi:vancomycin resistance protein YoaR
LRPENSSIYASTARRRPGSARRIAVRRGVLVAVLLLGVGALIGVAFAGSRTTLAAGSQVAGIDVGGLSVNHATALLVSRAKEVEHVPITFVAGGKSFRLSSSQLGVEANWAAAVRVAAAEGDGFGPVRGFRRLHTRIFGAEVAPAVSAYTTALDYKLDQVAAVVDRAAVDARLERKGLRVAVVPGQSGRRLDREAAANVIVRALGAFQRGTPVALPVVAAPPGVQRADLVVAARQARTALSAPVRLTYGTTRWRLPRWRIAELLALPTAGATRVAVAGDGAERYLERLAATVGRAPQDARFQVTSKGEIVIAPSQPGLELDMPATVRALSAALFSPAARTAQLAVRVAAPDRTTEEASTMGITGVVGSYTTTYGGTEGRLHNVQLVAKLIDGALVAPGSTFSFNDTTGERSAEKGFEDAPVIINGELQNGIGGGVCQVSTTVFNAAFEAGLQIDRRTNHALYISHYPLGRDATVNYPDLDLRFTNDTEHWLLLRTFVGAGSLTVNLYGTPVDRRVESETSPLVVTGKIPVKATDDPTLKKGIRVLDQAGVPPRETSVHRVVYDTDGTVLHDDVWRSYYVGEPSLVRVGTKEPPKKKKQKQVPADGADTTGTMPGAGTPATPPPDETPAVPTPQ